MEELFGAPLLSEPSRHFIYAISLGYGKLNYVRMFPVLVGELYIRATDIIIENCNAILYDRENNAHILECRQTKMIGDTQVYAYGVLLEIPPNLPPDIEIIVDPAQDLKEQYTGPDTISISLPAEGKRNLVLELLPGEGGTYIDAGQEFNPRSPILDLVGSTLVYLHPYMEMQVQAFPVKLIPLGFGIVMDINLGDGAQLNVYEVASERINIYHTEPSYRLDINVQFYNEATGARLNMGASFGVVLVNISIGGAT